MFGQGPARRQRGAQQALARLADLLRPCLQWMVGQAPQAE